MAWSRGVTTAMAEEQDELSVILCKGVELWCINHRILSVILYVRQEFRQGLLIAF
jgi:dethiobiotin synthetase